MDIIHGDIEPENILISADIHALLCDFGFSRRSTEAEPPELQGVGKLTQMSPETVRGNPTSPPTDVYAFGITIYQVLSGKVRWHDYRSYAAITQYIVKGGRPPKEPEHSQEGTSYDLLWDVAEHCWREEPADRPSMAEVHRCIEERYLPPQASIANSTTHPSSHGEAINPNFVSTRGNTPFPVDFDNATSSRSRFRTILDSIRPAYFNSTTSVDAAWSEYGLTQEQLIRRAEIKFDRGKPVSVATPGGFCTLFRGKHKVHGTVALKRLDVDRLQLEERTVEPFKAELLVWQSLSHSNILPFLGPYIENDQLYLVSPWADNGFILEYLKAYPDADRRRLIGETANALQYIHGRGFVHGDIKAQNILVSEGAKALLCDFGLSRLESVTTIPQLKGTGSRRWCSPELWKDEPKSQKSDVYAFGITIHQIMGDAVVPFSDTQDVALYHAIVIKEKRPPKEPTSRNGESYLGLWDLAERCWNALPEDRPSMKEVVAELSS
ncbi:hypothetical protein FRB99_006179 [Tulasnella sp. 403]|nr:hypothetical protein FRB99_006179 [Tulasnella sp. 403]